MLPKKQRRSIVVDDTLYYYLITGYITITVLNSKTGELFQNHQEVKPKWKIKITPSYVKELINNHNRLKISSEVITEVETFKFAVYEKSTDNTKDHIVIGPFKSKDEAESLGSSFGYSGENYYVDVFVK